MREESREGLVDRITNQTGGESTMRKIILIVGILVLAGSAAFALTTDSVLLTVTPVFTLSVNISSDTGTFGTNVTLGSSKTICVGDITNDGNVSAKWQKSAASQSGCATGGTYGWSLVSGNGTNPSANQFKLLVVTTGTTVSPDKTAGGSTFADSAMAGDHVVATGIGCSAAATDLMEGGTTAPSHPASEARKLWVSILMPKNVSVSDQQTITLSVTAVAQ